MVGKGHQQSRYLWPVIPRHRHIRCVHEDAICAINLNATKKLFMKPIAIITIASFMN